MKTLRLGAERWAMLPLAAAGSIAIGLWLYVAWHQVFSPMELFNQEGAIVDHIRRVSQGQPIYVAPSLQFVPYLYTPGYYWVSAVFAWAGDLAFVVPRAVSLVATLVSLACLMVMVRRAGGSLLWGVVAAGAFALAASRVEAWYALAQVDNLFVMALAVALLLAQRANRSRHYFVVGLVFAAAFWCKQSGLLAGLAFAAVILLAHWRFAISVVLGLALGIVPLLAWLILASDGWFWFYAFVIPASYGEDFAKLLVLAHDVARFVPGFALGLGAILWWWRGPDRVLALKGLAAAAAMLVPAIAGRLHVGGHVNTLIPMVWLMALALGVGGAVLMRAVQDGALRWRWIAHAALAAATLQFGAVAYDLTRFMPAQNGAAVMAQMKATLAQAGQPALLPGAGYLIGTVAGADPAALLDVFNVDARLRRQLLDEMEQAMRQKKFAAVVIEQDAMYGYRALYEDYYRAVGPLSPDSVAQQPRTGLDFGPLWLLVPRH